MFYSAVEVSSSNNDIANGKNDVTSRLAIATSKTPEKMESWVRYPPIFSQWSKSGAILFRDDIGAPPLLFWGDLAITAAIGDFQGLHYSNIKKIIEPRKGYFDSLLVESGPPPERLSDGNYFFIYNSADNV